MNEQSLTAAQSQQQDQIVDLVAKLEQGCLTQLQQSGLSTLFRTQRRPFFILSHFLKNFLRMSRDIL